MSCYIIGHTLGYFLYDMVFAEWFGVHDLAMRLHHIGSLVGGWIFYQGSVGASITVICIIVEEISNPFILSRDILRLKGADSGFCYKLIEWCFVVTFVFFRLFGAHLALINTWITGVNWAIRFFMALVHCLGVHWVYIVLRLVSKRLRPDEGPSNCVLSGF